MLLCVLHGSSYYKISNYKNQNKCWKNNFSHQVYKCALLLHLYARNNKRCHGIRFFLVQKDIDYDMDKNNENNINDEAEEPEVYVFKVSSLRK